MCQIDAAGPYAIWQLASISLEHFLRIGRFFFDTTNNMSNYSISTLGGGGNLTPSPSPKAILAFILNRTQWALQRRVPPLPYKPSAGEVRKPPPLLLDTTPFPQRYITTGRRPSYRPQLRSDGDCKISNCGSERYKGAMSSFVGGGSPSLGGSKCRFFLASLSR